jgi:glycosyltransferase involved in cell wall biosynthesis
MESPYLFSYIIGYRHSQERLLNLRRVLDWLRGFSGVEVIIVEQDREPILSTFTLFGFKYIFTKSEHPYNRSWAFNVGLKNSTTNAIVFGDSDLIMDRQDFVNSLNLLNQYECVSPYSAVLDLDRQESFLPIESMVQISRLGRGETDNQKINLCGGIVMYRKDSIYRIGGWSERFFGWGCEDNYQEYKTKGILTWTENKARCYHLFHSRGIADQNLYYRMLDIMNKLMSVPIEDTKKMVQSEIPKIGMINKLA